MLIIPAIDLQDGRCVRLLRGDFAQETMYGDDPVAMAGRWYRAGAEVLHVVDLDGARRVVLGTAALDLDLVAGLVASRAEQLIVALDTRGDTVAVQGWVETSDWSLLDLARALIEVGVRRFLHTDVERDGALTSPNFASLERLAALGMPVIASGGVSSLADIERLRECGADAVIVGRALYEEVFTLEEAMAHAG
jgi:phosphoribosylformimino-5-aminoimidazole carboxamide ribotide isomerase